MIESDQRSGLAPAYLKQIIVRGTGKSLKACSHDVMAGGSQQFQAACTTVLVELGLHATSESGSGMTRSRVISAP